MNLYKYTEYDSFGNKSASRPDLYTRTNSETLVSGAICRRFFFKERKRMKTWSCLFSNIIKLIGPFLFRVNSDYNNQREQRN